MASFQVQLIRQPLLGGSLTNLATFQLSSQPDNAQFQEPRQIPPTTSPVDNTTEKYLITALIRGADAAAIARLFGIQVTCSFN